MVLRIGVRSREVYKERIVKDYERWVRQTSLNTSVILELISLLKRKDKKFKKFETIPYIFLRHNDFTNKEESFFSATLFECANLPIAEMPSFEKFREMIIKKGGNEKVFTPYLTKRLLKALVYRGPLYIPDAFVAYRILSISGKIDLSK